MLVKFLSHGKGSARAAVEYLVGERDAAGQERDGVEVLRGNPDMVAAVADSLDFERRYTSAVIAWAPEDRRSDRSRPRRVREDRVGGTGAGPLRVDGGSAPGKRRRRPRAHPRRAVRPTDGPQPQHRAARLAEDLRPAARRLQPRARLEPSRRPGAGAGAAAGPRGLHRGVEAAGRAGTRGRPAHAHPRLPRAARRARRGQGQRRRGLRPGGRWPGGAAPRQGLHHRPRSRQRQALAAEGRTV